MTSHFLRPAALRRRLVCCYYLFDRRTEILEDDARGVTAGRAGYRAARVGRSAGLIKAGNRHSVLRPTRRRAKAAAEGKAAIAAVEGPVDHVRVGRLNVGGGPDQHRLDDVRRQVRRDNADLFQQHLRERFLQEQDSPLQGVMGLQLSKSLSAPQTLQ